MELQEAAAYKGYLQGSRIPRVVRVDYGPLGSLAKNCDYAVVVHEDHGDHTECTIFIEPEDIDSFIRGCGLPPLDRAAVAWEVDAAMQELDDREIAAQDGRQKKVH